MLSKDFNGTWGAMRGRMAWISIHPFSGWLLLEVMFANWAPSCRALVENVSEWFSVFFLFYRCVIGVALINVQASAAVSKHAIATKRPLKGHQRVFKDVSERPWESL